MSEIASDREISPNRIRAWWIAFPIFLLGLVVLTVSTHFKSVAKTKSVFRQSLDDRDWVSIAQKLVPIKLQKGTMPPEKLAAFLDRYIGKTKKLDIFETEYVGQTGIEATFADDKIEPSMRSLAPKFSIQVATDPNIVPGLPKTPRTKYAFDMTFVMVAMHEFPDTERFDPHSLTTSKSAHHSKSFVPSQYLFAVREKKNLESMGIPTYWDGTLTPHSWDDFISSLRLGLARDGWDVAALLAAYKLEDSHQPRMNKGAAEK